MAFTETITKSSRISTVPKKVIKKRQEVTNQAIATRRFLVELCRHCLNDVKVVNVGLRGRVLSAMRLNHDVDHILSHVLNEAHQKL
jgi:hypothetical protein